MLSAGLRGQSEDLLNGELVAGWAAGERSTMNEHCDIAIIGCGAAGLMAAIAAGRTAGGLASSTSGRRPRIIALDGATKIGAKILVAGGGRCNVTHYHVDESAYAGSSPPAIRNVLGRFPVSSTIEFFRELDVHFKREDTGKLFPTTDDAHTVLDALLAANRNAGVELRHPARVTGITPTAHGFEVRYSEAKDSTAERLLTANRVILATGGRSLPKTGSDGAGYEFAKALGHTLTPRVFPALVPLLLHKDHWLCGLTGIACDVTLELRSASGKRLKSFTNSLLMTHFGLSGPAALDMSRYWTAEAGGPANAPSNAPVLAINWTRTKTLEEIDAALQNLGTKPIGRWLHSFSAVGPPAVTPESLPEQPQAEPVPLPQRLVQAICQSAGVDPASLGHTLTRERRRALAGALTQTIAPVAGDRGYLFAEVTAGGVPLKELRLDSMESRITPGLHLCGEICDVDGRIGGFNFQWAWASGWVAGKAAAENQSG
jgi:predicted Rossmann fold flavoprotein